MQQEWTVKDGKVLSLEGEWLTPRQLLLAVKAQILAEPELYDQAAVVEACGTPCCIGGWALVLTTTKVANLSMIITVGPFLTGSKAVAWPWLFDACWGSKPKLNNQLAKAKTLRERAEAGAAAIDLFIEERGL